MALMQSPGFAVGIKSRCLDGGNRVFHCSGTVEIGRKSEQTTMAEAVGTAGRKPSSPSKQRPDA